MTKMTWGAAALIGMATFGMPKHAEACGGCFVTGSDSTVVTGHRMVMSISKTQTVLWDQIQYAGDPSEFSWVLPIKPGARIEQGSDAFFEVLDAVTNTQVTGQANVTCGNTFGGDSSGFGCAAASADASAGRELSAPNAPAVDVIHQGTVGPYETVTLSSEDSSALTAWLAEHGYNLPEDIKPVIEDYVDEGFDFIALRLIPGVGIQQMTPVRVVTEGAGFSLPLRMVAAGTGPTTALSLFVISEGRYETANFPNAALDAEKLMWSFDTSSSNYSDLRVAMLEQNEGRTWLTSYAKQDTLFTQDRTTETGPGFIGPVTYNVGQSPTSTIAEAFVRQGLLNDETNAADAQQCLKTFGDLDVYASSSNLAYGVVVPDCAEGDEECTPPSAGEIPASDLACGKLDDLAVALTGMSPSSVWVTRLEAELPRAALDEDLLLQAADSQTTAQNRHLTQNYTGDPCAPGPAAVASAGKTPTKRTPGGGSPVAITLAMALLAWVGRRTLSRPRLDQALHQRG